MALLGQGFNFGGFVASGPPPPASPVVYEWTAFNASPNDPRNEIPSQTFANSANAVDGSDTTYAEFVYSQQDDLHLTTNECPGTDFGTISKVEIRYKYQDYANCSLWLYWLGATNGDESARFTNTGASGFWSDVVDGSWVDITSATGAPGTWAWTDVAGLELRIHCYSGGAPAEVYLAQVRVTFS